MSSVNHAHPLGSHVTYMPLPLCPQDLSKALDLSLSEAERAELYMERGIAYHRLRNHRLGIQDLEKVCMHI